TGRWSGSRPCIRAGDSTSMSATPPRRIARRSRGWARARFTGSPSARPPTATRGAGPLECVLDVLVSQHAPVAAVGHADHIEADRTAARWRAVKAEPFAGESTQPRLLLRADRKGGALRPG